MVLTKAEIVEKVTEDLGFTRTKAGDDIESILKVIKSNLESVEDVLINGFWKFCVTRSKNAGAETLPQVKTWY